MVRLHKVATLATQNFRSTLLQGHVSLTQKLFLEHVKGVDSVDKKYLSSGPLKYFWTNYKRVFENNIWMHYGNRLVKHARNTFNIIKKEAVQEVNLWINGQCTLINEQERQKLVPITPANEKTIKSNTTSFFKPIFTSQNFGHIFKLFLLRRGSSRAILPSIRVCLM